MIMLIMNFILCALITPHWTSKEDNLFSSIDYIFFISIHYFYNLTSLNIGDRDGCLYKDLAKMEHLVIEKIWPRGRKQKCLTMGVACERGFLLWMHKASMTRVDQGESHHPWALPGRGHQQVGHFCPCAFLFAITDGARCVMENLIVQKYF